ncbi:transglycosylase SLT domain protein [Paenibacillus baekrokdamisoli]|uniref:Transglycosylase SLT domain protein n=1 Tax=Paenibacillus baekrokdamisoli TaxID=1712516 RepID=A0A3G9IJ88_9BACL|nr:lytic transglycosylase domain-containing protein [Paenibacillus baekrokdamisoli]MBB3072686.1 soluble lytic murein transglycosylase [Paenibacillus baekrokdamisoli]BBH18970.1 transglycosylase SLT domain protein [Paenibacillus baekrokdamisoli]
MKKRRVIKKRFFLFIVIVLLGLLFLKSDWMSRWLYPIHYKQEIQISAANYSLEPHLVAAIIRVETNFSNNAVSKKGAIGIMQLMPDTAKWIVKKGGFKNVTNDALSSRADISIEIGSWYLQSLNQQFKGNKYLVIAAYNAGPGKVNRWLSEGTWDGQLETVSRIPYGETRHYVQRVIYYYNKYKALYPDFLTK